MIALIDGDLVAFRCAATAEQEEEAIASARAGLFIEKLLMETDCSEFEIYFSGKNNFRYNIFPEYKANRIGKYRPKWEASTKEFLHKEWGAIWYEGAEADDILAIRQTELGDNSIIVSIDKDMKQVPGWHYQWEQTRKAIVVKEASRFYVTPIEGTRHFYRQLIIGDGADGIQGVPGSGPKAAAVLDDCTTEEEMFLTVRSMYDCDEAMLMNGQILWLQRHPGQIWEFPSGLD